MIGKLVSGIFQSLPRAAISSQLPSTAPTTWNPWSLTFVRNTVRYHFPHPSENKRIKRHGWFTRLSTRNGRRIIMRRILKGKHVLSH